MLQTSSTILHQILFFSSLRSLANSDGYKKTTPRLLLLWNAGYNAIKGGDQKHAATHKKCNDSSEQVSLLMSHYQKWNFLRWALMTLPVISRQAEQWLVCDAGQYVSRQIKTMLRLGLLIYTGSHKQIRTRPLNTHSQPDVLYNDP